MVVSSHDFSPTHLERQALRPLRLSGRPNKMLAESVQRADGCVDQPCHSVILGIYQAADIELLRNKRSRTISKLLKKAYRKCFFLEATKLPYHPERASQFCRDGKSMQPLLTVCAIIVRKSISMGVRRIITAHRLTVRYFGRVFVDGGLIASDKCVLRMSTCVRALIPKS